jgi:hypothetical protein
MKHASPRFQCTDICSSTHCCFAFLSFNFYQYPPCSNKNAFEKIQVHPEGMRHVRSNGRKHDWKSPGKSMVIKAAANQRQVALALSGGVIYYFELDETGQLLEVEKKDMGQDITSIDIAPLPAGSLRSRFLTVSSAPIFPLSLIFSFIF